MAVRKSFAQPEDARYAAHRDFRQILSRLNQISHISISTRQKDVPGVSQQAIFVLLFRLSRWLISQLVGIISRTKQGSFSLFYRTIFSSAARCRLASSSQPSPGFAAMKRRHCSIASGA